MSVFRSAITDATDGTVDAGYLSLFWIMAVVITAIPFMFIFTAVAMWLDPKHQFDVQALGIGIGSVCGGFGVAVGAVGAFRLGDKPRAPAAGTVTTTKIVTETETNGGGDDVLARGSPAKPLHVAVKAAKKTKR